MNMFSLTKKSSLPKRLLCGVTAFFFIGATIFPNASMAQTIPQTILNLPVPGTMVLLSPSFTPAMMKGMTIYPDDPFKFDFIIDKGDTTLEGEDFKAESAKLIKYFLASLTTSEEKMWVNLSPYEKDRIIADGFDTTEMGRDLLAQDYILKQLTASLLYPENEFGKAFWNKVYAQAKEKLGTTDIPMDTFNKVWIIPERAEVYVHGKSAFVVDSHLKVMLEEEYKSGQWSVISDQKKQQPLSTEHLALTTLKEIIIPEIEKEVNEGKNFAQLRQIYNSLILATWYKKNLKKSLFGQVYVDKNKTKGVDVEDKQIKQKIYDQYLAAFKKGAYDYIKEDYNPETQEVISRKYFSGGVDYAQLSEIQGQTSVLPKNNLARFSKSQPAVVTTEIKTTPKPRDVQKSSAELPRRTDAASLADSQEIFDLLKTKEMQETETQEVSQSPYGKYVLSSHAKEGERNDTLKLFNSETNITTLYEVDPKAKDFMISPDGGTIIYQYDHTGRFRNFLNKFKGSSRPPGLKYFTVIVDTTTGRKFYIPLSGGGRGSDGTRYTFKISSNGRLLHITERYRYATVYDLHALKHINRKPRKGRHYLSPALDLTPQELLKEHRNVKLAYYSADETRLTAIYSIQESGTPKRTMTRSYDLTKIHLENKGLFAEMLIPYAMRSSVYEDLNISEDGEWGMVITDPRIKTISVINLLTGVDLTTLIQSRTATSSITFLPHSNKFMVIYKNEDQYDPQSIVHEELEYKKIRIFDADSREEIHEFDYIINPDTNFIKFSADDQYAMAYDEQGYNSYRVRLIDLKKKHEVMEFNSDVLSEGSIYNTRLAVVSLEFGDHQLNFNFKETNEKRFSIALDWPAIESNALFQSIRETLGVDFMSGFLYLFRWINSGFISSPEQLEENKEIYLLMIKNRVADQQAIRMNEKSLSMTMDQRMDLFKELQDLYKEDFKEAMKTALYLEDKRMSYEFIMDFLVKEGRLDRMKADTIRTIFDLINEFESIEGISGRLGWDYKKLEWNNYREEVYRMMMGTMNNFTHPEEITRMTLGAMVSAQRDPSSSADRMIGNVEKFLSTWKDVLKDQKEKRRQLEELLVQLSSQYPANAAFNIAHSGVQALAEGGDFDHVVDLLRSKNPERIRLYMEAITNSTIMRSEDNSDNSKERMEALIYKMISNGLFSPNSHGKGVTALIEAFLEKGFSFEEIDRFSAEGEVVELGDIRYILPVFEGDFVDRLIKSDEDRAKIFYTVFTVVKYGTQNGYDQSFRLMELMEWINITVEQGLSLDLVKEYSLKKVDSLGRLNTKYALQNAQKVITEQLIDELTAKGLDRKEVVKLFFIDTISWSDTQAGLSGSSAIIDALKSDLFAELVKKGMKEEEVLKFFAIELPQKSGNLGWYQSILRLLNEMILSFQVENLKKLNITSRDAVQVLFWLIARPGTQYTDSMIEKLKIIANIPQFAQLFDKNSPLADEKNPLYSYYKELIVDTGVFDYMLSHPDRIESLLSLVSKIPENALKGFYSKDYEEGRTHNSINQDNVEQMLSLFQTSPDLVNLLSDESPVRDRYRAFFNSIILSYIFAHNDQGVDQVLLSAAANIVNIDDDNKTIHLFIDNFTSFASGNVPDVFTRSPNKFTPEEVVRYLPILFNVIKGSEGEIEYLFSALPSFKKIISNEEDFKRIVEGLMSFGPDTINFIISLTENFDHEQLYESLVVLIDWAKDIKLDSSVFFSGLNSLKSIIHNKDDLIQIGNILIDIFDRSGDQNSQLLSFLNSLGISIKNKEELIQTAESLFTKWFNDPQRVNNMNDLLSLVDDLSNNRLGLSHHEIASLGLHIIHSGVPKYIYMLETVLQEKGHANDKYIQIKNFLLKVENDLETRMLLAAHYTEVIAIEERLPRAEEGNGRRVSLVDQLGTTIAEIDGLIEESQVPGTSSSKQRRILNKIITGSLNPLRKSYLEFLLDRDLSEQQGVLFENPDIFNKVMTIVSILTTLGGADFQENTLVREIMRAGLEQFFLTDTTDVANPLETAATAASHTLMQMSKDKINALRGDERMGASNAEIIESLKAKGFSSDLWDKGIDISANLGATNSLFEKRKRIRQAAYEMVEIAIDLGFKKMTLAEADQLGSSSRVDEFLAAFREEMKKRNIQVAQDKENRLNEIQKDIKKWEDEKVNETGVQEYRITFIKNFLNETNAGVGRAIPGCFHPKGIHREMPLIHAAEANAGFLQIYSKDGVQVGNAVVILTEDGAYVYGGYTGGGFDSDLAFARGIMELSKYVPKIYLNKLISAGDRTLANYSETINEEVTLFKPHTIFEDQYFDHGGNRDSKGMELKLVNPQLVTYEGLMAKGAFRDLVEEREAEKPTVEKAKIDFQFLADVMIGKKIVNGRDYTEGEKKNLKKFFPLLNALKNALTDKDSLVVDDSFYDWVQEVVKKSRIKGLSMDNAEDRKEVDEFTDIFLDVLEVQQFPMEIHSAHEGDNAVLADTDEVGGIDLNPNQMDLQTTGEDAPLYAPVDPAMLENMINIDGAYPVILNVTPVLNLPLLLGIKELPREESLSYVR